MRSDRCQVIRVSVRCEGVIAVCEGWCEGAMCTEVSRWTG